MTSLDLFVKTEEKYVTFKPIRKKAREAYKSSRLDYELVQPCINRRPDYYYMLLEILGKT